MSERLKAWRLALAPREVELSNGQTVLVRPVNLEDLVLDGSIPVTLGSQIKKLQKTKGGNYRQEDADKLFAMLEPVVLAAVVDPPVTREGDENNLALDEIWLTDRMAIFEEANRAATALKRFRGQPNGDADAARGGDDV